MRYDDYGQVYVTTGDLCDMLYKNPELDLTKFLVKDPDEFNASVESLHYKLDRLNAFSILTTSIEEFDRNNQESWYMPDSYKELDIAKWLLDRCTTQDQLQRVGKELLLYQERNLFNLLKYLKYLIDTLRENNVVWGVGRGSSVASYVLYLIGVHRIDSIKYELDIEEFLK